MELLVRLAEENAEANANILLNKIRPIKPELSKRELIIYAIDFCKTFIKISTDVEMIIEYESIINKLKAWT